MTQTSFTENKVKILPESLINKIAAGEVVERPASVVKELLENAIDAGATEVQVSIKNGGKDLISILDNGCGMNESDAQLAVERHATSKIMDEEDLFRIRTLGFRGEALASIAAVSHFEILTCNDESHGATRIFIKGGCLEQVGKIGFPKGTKVTVERLFYNTPARLKFLKTTATELQHIQQHIVQKSLAHPHICFRLTHNRQMLLNLPGGQDLKTRIQQLFGEDFKEILMTINHEETYLQFYGFISFPSKPRTSRRWQYIFVNERNIKSSSINRGIYDGYGTFLGKGQQPIFFLNLHIDPSEIDVNVHPAKTEIRFRNNQLIHTILSDQISRALKEGASRRFFGREHSHTQTSRSEVSGQIELPMEDSLPLEEFHSGDTPGARKTVHAKEARELPPRGSLKSTASRKKHTFPEETLALEAKPVRESPNSHNEIQGTTVSVLSRPVDTDFSAGNDVRNLRLIVPLPESPKKIHVLGQFRKKYIIAENDAGLVLIDQRALHERLLYDIYAKELQKKEVSVQTFKASLLLEVTPPKSVLLEQSMELLALSGFTVSPFGGSTFAVNTIPECLNEDQVEKVMSEILECLVLPGKRVQGDDIFKDLSQVVAEYGSIVSEQELTQSEMECLLAQWEELGSPMSSIKGTPILVEFPLQELVKRLRH